MIISRLVLALAALLAGCAHPVPHVVSHAVFTTGQPYQAGGEWFYPRAFDSYDATGLASIIRDHASPTTADQETYDADALAAASPVLQLPAIVTVTNLVNGRTLRVRVNERGPMVPGRVLAVTPRVARLLHFPTGGIVEVRVRLDQAATAALDGPLGDAPHLTAAPVAGITAQNLAPPGGGVSGQAVQLMPQDHAAAVGQTVALSGKVTQETAAPGPLWVQISGFGSEGAAFTNMHKLYGMPVRVVPVSGGGRLLWAVRAGPYHSVAAADKALQDVLARGLPDPEIIVR